MLKGHQSWLFDNNPVISGAAAIVGPFEGQGPLAQDFDIVHGDLRLGQDSWEKAERMLLEEAANLAIEKSGITKESINFLVGGDLMNQIISSTFAARTLQVPYIGVFGACSTSMESLAIAANLVNSRSAKYAMASACSHNATAEKQFRYPTEYGSQKPPTAQFSVTGAGVSIVTQQGKGPHVTSATMGRVVDMGITDPFNMGAAMAPAAVDTIQAHFRDFKIEPGYYDLIVTGDLSKVGYAIANEMFEKNKFPIQQTVYKDCGMMMYDYEKQKVQAGASGAGCSATVTYGHLLRRMREKELNRILVVATGALLSPISYQQGETIPCIAHAVSIENEVRQT
ncbi:stage V sporulation protein AD [Paenibacillus glycanilyticus]|uniref:stage V sporulation protein AD n=1 Tax=Paenibacillus glycanilyticus TaxID=126569 RepID=UPI00204042BB|nr:stage V sporulation protein AD [Paenibacillus glycanilyticus]MCM3626582.1 stage V sporulation protein AD [Paenibacillus glycanilyticus]